MNLTTLYHSILTIPYQLFIVVSGEVPYVNGPALVPHNESSLVGMKTHAVDWSIDLEQSLALLSPAPAQ